MAAPTRIGLCGLAVMGQNLALNIAEKGFPISVYNRTTSKVDETVERAKKEGNLPVFGFHDPEAFVHSIQKPRVIIILVKAGSPVDQTIKTLSAYMEKGDCIIDGGNEWYENTERREKEMNEKGLLYLGMGVSGGEEGARHGPSLMPGGSFEGFKYIEDILVKVAAQVSDSGPCVTYIGKGGSGNFVEMVHNGIEYGDMQLIAEAYEVPKSVGKLSNGELQEVFPEWNKGELLSFLNEITAAIFGITDDKGDGYLVDKVLGKTGMKGTGKWTVQQIADLSVAAPTIAASLDSRFLSGLKENRIEAAKVVMYSGVTDILTDQNVVKKKLVDVVIQAQALYASKISNSWVPYSVAAADTASSWPVNRQETSNGADIIIKILGGNDNQRAKTRIADVYSLAANSIIASSSGCREFTCDGWTLVPTTAHQINSVKQLNHQRTSKGADLTHSSFVIQIDDDHQALPVMPDETKSQTKINNIILGITGQAAVALVSSSSSDSPFLRFFAAATGIGFLGSFFANYVLKKPRMARILSKIGAIGAASAVIIALGLYFPKDTKWNLNIVATVAACLASAVMVASF